MWEGSRAGSEDIPGSRTPGRYVPVPVPVYSTSSSSLSLSSSDASEDLEAGLLRGPRIPPKPKGGSGGHLSSPQATVCSYRAKLCRTPCQTLAIRCWPNPVGLRLSSALYGTVRAQVPVVSADRVDTCTVNSSRPEHTKRTQGIHVQSGAPMRRIKSVAAVTFSARHTWALPGKHGRLPKSRKAKTRKRLIGWML